MAYENGLVTKHGQEASLDVPDGRGDALEVLGRYPAEPGVVVDDLLAGVDQGLVDGLAVDVEDGDPGELVAGRGVAHLAVERVDAVVAVGRLGPGQGGDEPAHVVVVEDVGDVAVVHLAARGVGVALAAGPRGNGAAQGWKNGGNQLLTPV